MTINIFRNPDNESFIELSDDIFSFFNVLKTKIKITKNKQMNDLYSIIEDVQNIKNMNTKEEENDERKFLSLKNDIEQQIRRYQEKKIAINAIVSQEEMQALDDCQEEMMAFDRCLNEIKDI